MALKALLCSGYDASPQHRSVLRAMHTLNTPKNYTRLLGKSFLIERGCQSRAQGLMWGARGPFLLAAAMMAMVVLINVGHWDWELMSDCSTIGISKLSTEVIIFIPT
jgi:hypothetical protein